MAGVGVAELDVEEATEAEGVTVVEVEEATETEGVTVVEVAVWIEALVKVVNVEVAVDVSFDKLN